MKVLQCLLLHKSFRKRPLLKKCPSNRSQSLKWTHKTSSMSQNHPKLTNQKLNDLKQQLNRNRRVDCRLMLRWLKARLTQWRLKSLKKRKKSRIWRTKLINCWLKAPKKCQLLQVKTNNRNGRNQRLLFQNLLSSSTWSYWQFYSCC